MLKLGKRCGAKEGKMIYKGTSAPLSMGPTNWAIGNRSITDVHGRPTSMPQTMWSCWNQGEKKGITRKSNVGKDGKDCVEVEHGFHFGRGKDPRTPDHKHSHLGSGLN